MHPVYCTPDLFESQISYPKQQTDAFCKQCSLHILIAIKQNVDCCAADIMINLCLFFVNGFMYILIPGN